MTAPDILAEVFPPLVIEALQCAPNPTKELRTRLLVLTADRPHIPELSVFPELRVYRDAWGEYLSCAWRLGFFEGSHGGDLRTRLVGRDDDLFASAMSECLAAWFLAERLSMVVSPRPKGQAAHILEMAIELPGGHINVEVKAPHRPFPLTTQAGDDSDALRAVIKSANEQFARHEKNLLVIIPRLPVFCFEEPRALQRLVALKAFVIEETLRVAIDPATGGPAGPVYIAMRPSGEFVKPRGAKARWFTRTGGALLINEHVGMPMRYSAMLIHNPCALNRLPKDLWNGVDQFCEADGQWAWRSSECA